MSRNKNIVVIIIWISVIFNLAFSQNSKIEGKWRYVGDSNEELSLDGYIKSNKKSYETLKDNKITCLIFLNLKKDSTFIEDDCDYKVFLAKYHQSRNDLTVFIHKEIFREYRIITLTKTDLILYNKKTEKYFYYIKNSKLKKRILKLDRLLK